MRRFDKGFFVLGNELWEEHFQSLSPVKAYIIDIWEERKSRLIGDIVCQQPSPYSPTRDLAGVGRIAKDCVLGVKPGTGKLHIDLRLCGSANSSGSMVDGL